MKCDRSKIIDKSEDVHDICNKECADVTKSIDEFYTKYGHYSPVTWLHKRCGFITRGNCDFLFREYFPMCYCLTPIEGAGHRSSYALTCRYAITGIRNVLNAAIYARQREARLKQEQLRKLRARKKP
nr:PREDICTED: uncharacterized protein LOC109031702 [Bemisia tabaci]